MTGYELVLVMPVYNEKACICQVVDAWHDELTRFGMNFQMIILNDGSRDGTGAHPDHRERGGAAAVGRQRSLLGLVGVTDVRVWLAPQRTERKLKAELLDP